MAKAEYKVIGTSPARMGGIDRVIGKGVYGIDLMLKDQLHGAILRSQYAHAKIISIDTSEAKKLPGVHAVITAEDAPNVRYGRSYIDRHILARGKVRFMGDPVAAVAADTMAIAEAALDLIRIEWRQLPAVFDPEAALLPGAPQVRAKGNLAGGEPILMARGDVAAGFAQADLVVEETYTTPFTSAIPLEPRGCIAAWDGDRLTVWKSGRNVYGDRSSLAAVFGMPLNKIRVMTPVVGGSFGNKDESRLQFITALLAKKAGRPVKLCYSLSEELRAGRWRHPSKITVKMGVTRDGAITAIDATCMMNTGPYVPGTNVCRRSAHGLTYLYTCANVRFTGYVVFTNTPVAGSYRALGAPQGHFALESHIDLVAEKLGIDPLAFRLKNHVPLAGQPGATHKPSGRPLPPQPIAGGIPFSSNGLDECLTQGGVAAEWRSHPAGPTRRLDADGRLRGTGVAACIYQTGQAPSSAIVRVEADGTAEVYMGTLDVGQGSSTVLTIMAAETLGLPLSKVVGYFADAETTPFSHGTVGSTTTFSSGIAVQAAARDARRQLLELGADALEAPVEALDIKDGVIFALEAPNRQVTVVDALRNRLPRQIVGTADTRAGSDRYIINAFAAHFAEVSVDPDTGEVRVLRYVAAHDCGQPINLMAVEGQIEGGVMQGLGLALTEQLGVDPTDGSPTSANLDTFKVPAQPDMPAMQVLLVDSHDAVGPFGAKAVGEVPVAPVAAAIANAVYDATGVRIRDLPVTAEKVLRGLRELG